MLAARSSLPRFPNRPGDWRENRFAEQFGHAAQVSLGRNRLHLQSPMVVRPTLSFETTKPRSVPCTIVPDVTLDGAFSLAHRRPLTNLVLLSRFHFCSLQGVPATRAIQVGRFRPDKPAEAGARV